MRGDWAVNGDKRVSVCSALQTDALRLVAAGARGAWRVARGAGRGARARVAFVWRGPRAEICRGVLRVTRGQMLFRYPTALRPLFARAGTCGPRVSRDSLESIPGENLVSVHPALPARRLTN